MRIELPITLAKKIVIRPMWIELRNDPKLYFKNKFPELTASITRLRLWFIAYKESYKIAKQCTD